MTSDDPKLIEALNLDERDFWINSVHEEFENLHTAGAWVKNVMLQPDDKILPTGTIVKLKRDEIGRPKRFKARLVARGNLHQDYKQSKELYATVDCIDSVRTLLAVECAKRWLVHHLII